MQPQVGGVRPLRLVHVLTVPLSLRLLRGQLESMRARGLEVHVISSPGPLLDECRREQHVITHAVDIPRRMSPLRDLRALVGLLRTLRRIRPDIVHSGTPKAGLLGTVAACLLRVPARIYHMRGALFPEAVGLNRRILRGCERVACSAARRVLFNSESTRRLFVDEGLCPPDRAFVLHHGSSNGVDAAGLYDPARWTDAERRSVRAELGLPADAPVLGFIGRLVPDKGIVELVEAWRLLRTQYTDLRLVLVGPFESETPLLGNTLAELAADERVILTGALGAAETARRHAVIDVLALPTYREGFPNVLLEAAAMAVPVVATRVFGCVDAVVDGVTGTLVAPRDARALALAIGRYLGDPELRRAHGAAARARALRDYVPGDIWDAVYGHYLDLLARGPGPVRSG